MPNTIASHISKQNDTEKAQRLSFQDFKNEVLSDYKIARISRECSLLGRREVLTGKAKFGIFGGGKEVPQLAMAKVFQKGDFRSGYYRDQTFMMALGELASSLRIVHIQISRQTPGQQVVKWVDILPLIH